MTEETYRLSVEIDSFGAESKVGTLKTRLTELTGTSKQLDDAFKRGSQSANLYQQSVSKIDGISGKIRQTLDKLKISAKGAGDGVEQAGKDIKQAGNNAKDAKSKFDGLGQAFGRLKGLMLAGMAVVGVGSIVQTADAMKTLDSQIKIATGSAEKHAIAMSEIERIAMANNVSLSSVGEMYVSNERALKQLGKSQSEVLKFTENVTQAMRLGGGSAEGQAAALTQLGQALASGVLRGDEFNSIAEQAPAIMDLLSQSLGVTTGELREMAGEGKLTADVLYKAMTDAKATDKLQSMASQTSTTVQGALENVRTQWDLAVHTIMNSKGGISDIIAGGILLVADGLQKVGNYLPVINQYISDVISKGKELWNSFTNSEIGKASIDAVKSAFDLLKDAIQGVVDIADGITKFFQENPELAIALASGLTAATTAYFIITGAMSLFATVSGAVAAAGGLAAMATTALGAAIAFLTSPITLTVAAIAALVAIGVYLYRNWDTLGQKASEVWNGIKQWASDAWQGVVDTWNGFTEWFGGLFDGFGLDGIWDSLTSGVSNAWESVKTTIAQKWESIKAWFSGNGDLLSGVWQSIKDGVSNAWDSIKQAVIDKFNQIKEAFNEWLSGQPAPVQEMIDNIISIFTGLVAGIGVVWDLVGSGASAAWDGIKTAASTAKEWVQSTWEGLSSGLSSTWESIKSGASSAWESAKSTASSAWESVKNTVSSKLEQAKTTASKLSDGVARGWDNAKELAGRAFDGVKNAIGDKLGQAKDTAKSKFDEIKNSISNSGIGEAMSKGLNTLTSIASSALNGVKAVFSAAITAWRAILQAGLTIFATLFNTAFNTIKTVVQTAFAVIKGVITGDVNAIKTAFSNGFNQLGNIARQAGQNILSAFKNLGSQLLQAGRDAVQGFINGFTGKMGEALSKAREMASKIISTVKGALDIHSPSRKMKQLGEWVSEGLAIGIEYKTPMVEKSASDLAKAANDAFESEMTKLSRDIFLTQQKIAGNPFAELTTDIKFGKYDGVSKEKLDELIYLTNKSRIAQQDLEIREKNLQIARDIANVSKTEKELFFEQFELFDEMYQGAINNLKLKYDELQTAKNTHNLTQKIKELDEKILLTGKSELEVLQYQLDNAKEYWGVSDEIKQSYLDRTKALQEAVKAEERLKKIDEKGKNFEKSKYLISNRKDPDAQLKYELGKDGYNDEQIATMVKFAEYERQLKSVSDLMDKLEQKTLFGDAVNTANLTNWGGSFDFVTQFYQKQAQLDKVFSDEQSNLKQALDNGLITLQDHQEQEALLIEQHEAKKRQLKETSNQAILAGASSLMKTMYGENSKHYKWIFGLEKAYAISRILLQNKVALANAWASAPFPANLGAVAKVVAESGMLVSAVNAIKPIGQAHDGIMSVPKSGTWNLEKGERVLPRHTAKALDDKLDSVGNGTNQINIHINIDNNGNEQSPSNAQGTAKILADNIKAVVLQTLHQEKKQGGLLA